MTSFDFNESSTPQDFDGSFQKSSVPLDLKNQGTFARDNIDILLSKDTRANTKNLQKISIEVHNVLQNTVLNKAHSDELNAIHNAVRARIEDSTDNTDRQITAKLMYWHIITDSFRKPAQNLDHIISAFTQDLPDTWDDIAHNEPAKDFIWKTFMQLNRSNGGYDIQTIRDEYKDMNKSLQAVPSPAALNTLHSYFDTLDDHSLRGFFIKSYFSDTTAWHMNDHNFDFLDMALEDAPHINDQHLKFSTLNRVLAETSRRVSEDSILSKTFKKQALDRKSILHQKAVVISVQEIGKIKTSDDLDIAEDVLKSRKISDIDNALVARADFLISSKNDHDDPSTNPGAMFGVD